MAASSHEATVTPRRRGEATSSYIIVEMILIEKLSNCWTARKADILVKDKEGKAISEQEEQIKR